MRLVILISCLQLDEGAVHGSRKKLGDVKARDYSLVRYSKQLRVASSTAVKENGGIRLDSLLAFHPNLMFVWCEIL